MRDILVSAGSWTHEFKGGAGEWTYPAPKVNVEVKAVDQRCNGGWMSDLERHVQPTLTRMAAGRYIVLKPEHQRTLSLWAIKTALMFKCLDRSTVAFNEAHYENVYAHLPDPPPRSYVWLGRYDPSDPTARFRNRNLHRAETGIADKPPAFVTAFTVGQVAFLVIMYAADENLVLELESDYVVPILPVQGFVRWPLKRTFGLDAFPGLTDLLPEAPDSLLG